ncbi:MAG: DUF5947 family protein [Solirubrobacterales bacterium]
MSSRPGNGRGRPIEDRVAARRRSTMVASLRRLSGGAAAARPANGAPPAASEERCELCGTGIQEKHSHLLHLGERRILCVCTNCWAQGAADPEYRPTGSRVLWLEGFELPEDVWGRLQVPIGLAFFMESTSTGTTVALYPSPAGATESELELEAWADLKRANPVLDSLEPDVEALVVNRIADPPQFAIVPIDECYGLVGAIKASWEGISGGAAIERAVPGFFADVRERAVVRAR